MGVPIRKPLCSDITDRQLAKNNIGARVFDLLQLIIQNIPLCIDNRLNKRIFRGGKTMNTRLSRP